ncbi:MAG: hypothetical protein QNK37_18705 [Acidobacteriota bacterium]|nr:hypothetical protein [Acidobacteriota bacterium]
MLIRSEQVIQGIIPQLFLGGACALWTEDGEQRNTGRDSLAAWLNAQGISYFDPQIHISTHGRDYEWDIDGPVEKKVRQDARMRIYEISPLSLASVTMFEVFDDARRGRRSLVWFHHGEDYAPAGLGNFQEVAANEKLAEQVGPLVHAHMVGFLKAGRRMRKELVAMLDDCPSITLAGSEDEVRETISREFSL